MPQVIVSNIDKDFIWFSCPRNIAEKLGASFNDRLKLWKIPNTISGLEEILRYTNNGLIRAYRAEKQKKRERLLTIKKVPDTDGDPRLRPYQRVDVAFLSSIPHGALFNEQRTGKTVTMLGVVNKRQFKRIGLVAPASTLIKWQREVKDWTGKDAVIITGKNRGEILKSLRKADEFFFIIGFEMLAKEIDQFKFPMDCLIIDEAHKLRGRKTQTAKAVFKLGKKAAHRYAMTGTPAVRSADDVWSILHFLYPEKFPSYFQFVARYMEEEYNHFSYSGKASSGRAKRPKELREILETISVIRKQQDHGVMDWLPEKQRELVLLSPDPEQKKVYDEVERSFTYKQDGELLVDASNPLTQLIRLRQIAIDPRILGIQAGSAKTKYVMKYLGENADPVLIFSTSTSYLKYLENHLSTKGYSVGRITGDVTLKKRQKIVDDFQNGVLRVLLLNIKAAGVGLTLDRACTSIFVDREFNPADNMQAEDRMTPVSKDRIHEMSIKILAIKDTYDEVVEKILGHKYNVTEVVNQGGLKSLKKLYEELNDNEKVASVS